MAIFITIQPTELHLNQKTQSKVCSKVYMPMLLSLPMMIPENKFYNRFLLVAWETRNAKI